MHPDHPRHSDGRDPRVRRAVSAALFAALLCVSSWIVIPVGTVPLTLQVALVLLVGLVLGPASALSAVALYLAIGAIGVPVFSGGGAGLAWLFGPTGGYLFGFAAAAFLVAVVRAWLGSGERVSERVVDLVAVAIGVIIIYLAGWAQLAAVTGMGLGRAFVAGVVPFIGVDVAKAVFAVVVASALRRTGVV